jgi:hypothetical protein
MLLRERESTSSSHLISSSHFLSWQSSGEQLPPNQYQQVVQETLSVVYDILSAKEKKTTEKLLKVLLTLS